MPAQTRNVQMDRLALAFCRFVCHWLDHAKHWQENGKQETHEENLRTAVKLLLDDVRKVTECIARDVPNIAQVALTFPSLSPAPLDAIHNDPDILARWALGRGAMAQHSASFVLALADQRSCLGEFRFMDAFFAWDRPHREAFMLWMYSAG